MLVLLTAYSVNCTLNDPEENFTSEIRPNDQVLDTFNEKYPEAEDIVWHAQANCYVACFTRNSVFAYAWFSERGEWLLLAEDYAFDRLHHKIPEAFLKSIYAGWEIEKVDRLERKDMDEVYVIRVTESNRFVSLYYSGFGNFIRAATGMKDFAYYPLTIPAGIEQEIDKLFEQPEVIDYWQDELAVHVAIRNKATYLSVAFSFDYKWICTFQDIRKEDLPQVVWKGFESFKYAHYIIDYLRILYDSQGLAYLFYLSDDKGDKYILYMREDGTPDCIISY
ncbi:MAG: PepSY-like domain-containing protein [Tannerellaceae bacterium]|nr:PepSY-like domain-containing protein [Tannerellaceae bacterium]